MDKQPDLGPPAFFLGGLRAWVQGRQYPWENGYWDGNRLAITVLCRAQNSEVRIQGPYLHVGDILRWSQECESLLSKASDTVTLWAVEPELNIHLSARGDQVRAEVRISPNLANQEHLYRFEVGWDEVEVFLEALQRLLVTYPQRGAAQGARLTV
jgi:hypothetical protein